MEKRRGRESEVACGRECFGMVDEGGLRFVTVSCVCKVKVSGQNEKLRICCRK